jgi:hypothetical protein
MKNQIELYAKTVAKNVRHKAIEIINEEMVEFWQNEESTGQLAQKVERRIMNIRFQDVDPGFGLNPIASKQDVEKLFSGIVELTKKAGLKHAIVFAHPETDHYTGGVSGTGKELLAMTLAIYKQLTPLAQDVFVGAIFKMAAEESENL